MTTLDINLINAAHAEAPFNLSLDMGQTADGTNLLVRAESNPVTLVIDPVTGIIEETINSNGFGYNGAGGEIYRSLFSAIGVYSPPSTDLSAPNGVRIRSLPTGHWTTAIAASSVQPTEHHVTTLPGQDITNLNLITSDIPSNLHLALADSSINEEGSTTLTVFLTNPLSVDTLFTLSSSDTSEATLPASVLIPAGSTSVDVTVLGVSDALDDGNQVVSLTASSADLNLATSATLTVVDTDTNGIDISFADALISENGGSTIATVTLDTPRPVDTVVSIGTNDTTELSVPSSVIIAAFNTTATFTVDAVDDIYGDGTQYPGVNVFSDAGNNGRSIGVTDDENQVRTIRIDVNGNSVSEFGSTDLSEGDVVTMEVAFSAPLDSIKKIQFQSILGPDTTAFAGADYTLGNSYETTLIGTNQVATQVITVTDDLIDEPDKAFSFLIRQIDGLSFGFTIGLKSFTIVDDDTAVPEISIAETSIGENGGVAQATLSISNPYFEDVAFTLTSSQTSQATVPSSVTIPAGSTSVNFPISGVDNAIDDGTNNVTITATSVLDPATAAIDVTSDEIATLSFANAVSALNEGDSTTATVSLSVIRTMDTVINLATDDASEASIAPSTLIIPAGQTSVDVSVIALTDNLVDGDQTVGLIASSTGLTAATTSLDVIDVDTTSLGLSLAASSIDEGGATTLTVSLTTPTTTDTNVSLAIDDSTEASSPTSVVIPAGQTSVDVAVSALADNLVDGDQSVSLTASSAGLADTTASLTVTDVDTTSVGVALASSSVNEGASTTLTVSLTTPTTTDTTVSLAIDDSTEASAPTSVVIPAGQTSVDVTVSALTDNLVDSDQSVSLTASATGLADATTGLTVTDVDTTSVGVALASSSVNEGDSTTLTVSLTTPTTTDTTVSLAIDDSTEASAPTSVVIPAGQTSVDVTVSALTDNLVDGDQTVSLTASATELADATASLTVIDTDTTSLGVALAASSVNEGDTATLTVSLTTPTTTDTNVSLAIDDSTEASTPTSVVIPAGQTSVDVTVSALADNLVDGDQSVSLTASATGLADATTGLTVTDVDTTSVGVALASSSVNEGASTTLTVSLTTPTTTNTTVSLAIDDSTEASSAASVVIPAGQTSVDVTVSALADNLVDGDQSVSLTASATGLADATTGLTVIDVDTTSLGVALAASSVNEGNTATLTVSLSTPTTTDTTISLAIDDSTEASAPTSVIIPAGQTSVDVTVSALADNLVDGDQSVSLTASSAGLADTTASLDVVDVDTTSLGVALAASSVNEGDTTTLTLLLTTPTNSDTTVSLTIDDSTEASSPTSVVIPAGQTSVDVTISALNDNLVDGDQAVSLTASSAGLADATASLSVIDVDTTSIGVALASGSVNEGDSTTLTVSLSTPTTTDTTVSLTVDDVTEASAPTTVTIPAGQASVDITVTALADNLVDGDQTVGLTASSLGLTDATASLGVIDTDTTSLALSLSASSIDEGDSATLTVSLTTPTTTDTLVTLMSGDTTEATVAGSVTIAAGESSADVTLNAITDNLIDGPQTVSMTASSDLGGDSISLDVADADVQTRTVSYLVNGVTVPSLGIELNEGDELTIDVSYAIATTHAKTVEFRSFVSSDVTASIGIDYSLAEPSVVVLGPDDLSASLTIDINDDNVEELVELFRIRIREVDSGSPDEVIEITDFSILNNDTSIPSLHTFGSNFVSENGGTRLARVRLSGPYYEDLTFTLTSSDTDKATVPATLTVLAGHENAWFDITGVDNLIEDGDPYGNPHGNRADWNGHWYG